jgi:hypothetical protein
MRKLPSQWGAEGVFLIDSNWRPVPGDDCHAYPAGEGGKVEAVVEAYDGKTIRFNYVRRNRDHTREVVVVTQAVRIERTR